MHTKHHEEVPQSAATIQSDREPTSGRLCTETTHSLSRCLQHTLHYVSTHLNRAPNSSLGSAPDYMILDKISPHQDLILRRWGENVSICKAFRAWNVTVSVSDCQLPWVGKIHRAWRDTDRVLQDRSEGWRTRREVQAFQAEETVLEGSGNKITKEGNSKIHSGPLRKFSVAEQRWRSADQRNEMPARKLLPNPGPIPLAGIFT